MSGQWQYRDDDRFDIPAKLRRSVVRNKPLEARIESGIELLSTVRAKLGLTNFDDVRFLDIGCGDRIPVALINTDFPIRAYHGVDVNKAAIEHFQAERDRPELSFAHIDAFNAMYNPAGDHLTPKFDIGAEGREFDVIGLFSVFTHLAPEDWEPMLGIARRHVANNGRLIFTAFVEENQPQAFIDKMRERKSLLQASYSREAVDRFIADTGWQLTDISPPVEDKKRWLVCAPAKA